MAAADFGMQLNFPKGFLVELFVELEVARSRLTCRTYDFVSRERWFESDESTGARMMRKLFSEVLQLAPINELKWWMKGKESIRWRESGKQLEHLLQVQQCNGDIAWSKDHPVIQGNDVIMIQDLEKRRNRGFRYISCGNKKLHQRGVQRAWKAQIQLIACSNCALKQWHSDLEVAHTRLLSLYLENLERDEVTAGRRGKWGNHQRQLRCTCERSRAIKATKKDY